MLGDGARKVALGGDARRVRRVGRVHLVVEAVLVAGERQRRVEDRPPVLDRRHAARRERAAVAEGLDGVEDRGRDVAGEDEVGVERVREAVVRDGPAGGDECLGENLPAEDARRPDGSVAATEDVDLDRFEVEQVEQVGEGARLGRVGVGRLGHREDLRGSCAPERTTRGRTAGVPRFHAGRLAQHGCSTGLYETRLTRARPKSLRPTRYHPTRAPSAPR